MTKKLNECCSHNDRCRWAVGHNMPGYMPDGDVNHFSNWTAARDAFIDDVEQALDQESENVISPDDADKILNEVKNDLPRRRKTIEYSVEIGSYVYWLARI